MQVQVVFLVVEDATAVAEIGPCISPPIGRVGTSSRAAAWRSAGTVRGRIRAPRPRAHPVESRSVAVQDVEGLPDSSLRPLRTTTTCTLWLNITRSEHR